MDPALVSLVVLGLLFVCALLPRFDLGLGALAVSFAVASWAGLGAEDITGFFPADFFVLIVGVMALFGVASVSGTLDALLTLLLRLLRGRVELIPLSAFVMGMALSAVGTLPAAAVAIMAPIAMGLAARHLIPPILMALVTLGGILAGIFSPISVFGVATVRLAENAGMELPSYAPVAIALTGAGVGLILCLAYMVLWRVLSGTGPRSRVPAGDGEPVPSPTSGPENVDTDVPPPVHRRVAAIVFSAALACVIGGAVGFGIDIGYLAVTAAFVLQVALRIDPGALIAKIPWRVVLLIGGLLTYIGLMEHLGAFELLGHLLTVEGSPALTLLAVCYMAGVTSFFASSIAVLATAVPLLGPLVVAGVDPLGALIAVAMASVLVDVNPLGITGGLILGATRPEERDRLFRLLLGYGLVSVAVAPLLVWAVFGLF